MAGLTLAAPDAPAWRRSGVRRRAFAVLWLAVLLLAVAINVKTVPGAYRDARALSDMTPGQAANLRSSLARLRLTTDQFTAFAFGVNLLQSVIVVAIGILLMRRRSGDGFVALVSCILIAQNAANYPPDIPGIFAHSAHAQFWMSAARGMTVLAVGGFFILPFLLPNGRFIPRWTVFPAAYGLLGVALFAFAPGWSFGPFGHTTGTTDLVLTLAMLGTALASQVHRYRRTSTPTERQQTKWIVLCFAISFPAFIVGDQMIQRLHSGAESALVAVAFSVIMPVAFAALPVTLGFAILRHRLYYVDLVINRTLLLVTMTALVIGTYVAVVVALGSLIGAQGSLPLSLLATELVAVGFQPVKQRVQGALNRLLFGDRDDPYKVLSRLGRQLESTFAPDEILPAIVRTLTEALRLPYAAVYLGGAQPSLAAASGVPTGEAVRLPLTYQQEPVGELVVSPRASGEHFGASDRRLLADLARQIGVAAHAVRLTDDLQRSRERIVTAREEERRRLRRDLHDGLGAQLAALSIQAGALRRVIPTDPDAAVTQAAELGVELRAAVADIRRLVHGLRPPALDEVGLVAALRDRATRYGTGSIQQHADGARSSDRGLDVEFTARDDLSALPAAMEVAIYRIVDEALTNVMKHANATTCRVRLTHDAAIDLSIEDDGDGMSPTMRSGVGLMSMRERAEELGGAFLLGPGAGGRGTRVDVRFPFPSRPATPT